MGACHGTGRHEDLGDDQGAVSPIVEQDSVMDMKDKMVTMEDKIKELDSALERERTSKRELRDMLADLDENFVIIGRRDALDDPHIGMTLPPDGELTVLLFGMTGSGKSALGNLIIGEEVFLASDDTSSVTRLDSLLKFDAEDGSLTLLDTIGMGDTELTQEQVAKSVRDVALQAPHGIDIMLYVMKNERLTDDAIARFIYITEFCWGAECLPNLYVVVTHATRYATDRKEARDWINRNVQINWRFNHIFTAAGSDVDRFIFVDNPGLYSMEPKITERRRASRRSIMRTLCLHSRDVIPPFTNSMMARAVAMSQKLSDSAEAMKKKEQRIKDLKAKLDLVCTGKCDETDPVKLQVLQKEEEELELELARARLQKLEQKKKDSEALMAAAKYDKSFNNEVEKEAEKATRTFANKFKPAVAGAKKAVSEGVSKGAKASAAVVEDVAKACWRLASNFKLPSRGKPKKQGEKEEEKDDFWLSKELLQTVSALDPKMKAQYLQNVGENGNLAKAK